MIKDALQYIVGLRAPMIREINGMTWSDKPLERVRYNPKAKPIELNTLRSLVDFIQSSHDGQKMYIHIVSPTEVRMFSALDEDRERETLAVVNAMVPKFPFNTYMGHEEFCINLQSKFLPTEDRELLLKFSGTVEAGTVAQYGDDGVTQKATIRQGVASKAEAIVPNPVSLCAYRTFIEVDQPETRYIFRMKQNGNTVNCALFEADGDAWKICAKNSILEYLENVLDDVPGLIYLS